MFSSIFKLWLEFIVLNQLTSVAARPLKRETFEDRRYQMSAQADTFSNELRHFSLQDPPLSEQMTEASTAEPKIEAKKTPVQMTLPRASCKSRYLRGRSQGAITLP